MIITDGRLYDILERMLEAIEAVQANPLSDKADERIKAVRTELDALRADITPR